MNFHMPTKIVFGSGTLSGLKGIVSGDLRAKRPFLVTDPGVTEAGLTRKVISQLGRIELFDGVEPNPRSDTVNRAGEIARRIRPDAIIALGGGSAIDAAKAVALLATNEGPIERYEGREKYTEPPLPLVAVPTTCGTGSEVTWVSVITDTDRKFKMSIKGSRMFPAVALVDPDLLVSLPGYLVAATALDALTHAIEAYTSKPANIVTDTFALKAIQCISGSLEAAWRDIAGERGAREGVMYGSTLAGMAFGNSDVGAVHCLSESVGALFDIPHGVANAVFLPHVMDFNIPACYERYADIARLMGIHEMDDRVASRKLVDTIAALSRKLQIPTFRELKIDNSHFSTIARYSFQNNSNPSNPRDASVEDYLGILEKAL